MAREIRFERDDGKEFRFGTRPPFELSSETLLPEARTISVSAISHTGVNGGLTLGLRYERPTATIVYNIRNVGAILPYRRRLLEFFTPMTENLTPRSYTMSVHECNGDVWEMREGHVTGDPTTGNSHMLPIIVGGKLTMTFDDPLQYDMAETFSSDLNPISVTPLEGERWGTDGAMLDSSGSFQWVSDGGHGETVYLSNGSNVTIVPSIQLTGIMVDPHIINRSNGDDWYWAGTLGKGEHITIGNRGTLVDGRPDYTARGAIRLQPGSNTLELHAEIPDTDIGVGHIEWNEAF